MLQKGVKATCLVISSYFYANFRQSSSAVYSPTSLFIHMLGKNLKSFLFSIFASCLMIIPALTWRTVTHCTAAQEKL